MKHRIFLEEKNMHTVYQNEKYQQRKKQLSALLTLRCFIFHWRKEKIKTGFHR